MHDPSIEPALAAGRCPDCGGTDFRPGPAAGIAQNCECRGCKARFNVTHYNGQVVFCHRIEREDQGGSRWPDVIFEKGERVSVTIDGEQLDGEMVLCSENGISLAVTVHVNDGESVPLPLIYCGDGDQYALLAGNAKITVRRHVQ